jgi:hypothetical protein
LPTEADLEIVLELSERSEIIMVELVEKMEKYSGKERRFYQKYLKSSQWKKEN